MLIYIIPFFVSVIFLIVMILPVNMKIEYSRRDQDDKFKLDIYTFTKLFGLSIYIPILNNKLLSFFTEFFAEVDLFFLNKKSYKGDVDIEKEIDWENIHLDKVKKTLGLIMDKKLNTIIINNLKLRCKFLYWKTDYGWSNPALTGISNGFIWMFKGVIINILSTLLKFINTPELDVKPDFDTEKFSTHFSGIFSLLLGNIILTTMKVIFYKLSGLKIKRIFLSRLR
ncbi:MAG: DUF2953 domain-containing protein [Halanaerobiales bacterium]